MTNRVTVLASLVFSLGACDRKIAPAPPPPAQHIAGDAPTTRVVPLPTVTVSLNARAFVLEVARTADEQATGLMHRTSMPADHGMIFVFPNPQRLSFWMKNTRIPLDIAYLDANATVLNVEPMYPLDLRGVPSDGDAKYAIELNQGTAKQIGLRRGDRVALPADVR